MLGLFGLFGSKDEIVEYLEDKVPEGTKISRNGSTVTLEFKGKKVSKYLDSYTIEDGDLLSVELDSLANSFNSGCRATRSNDKSHKISKILEYLNYSSTYEFTSEGLGGDVILTKYVRRSSNDRDRVGKLTIRKGDIDVYYNQLSLLSKFRG